MNWSALLKLARVAEEHAPTPRPSSLHDLAGQAAEAIRREQGKGKLWNEADWTKFRGTVAADIERHVNGDGYPIGPLADPKFDNQVRSRVELELERIKRGGDTLLNQTDEEAPAVLRAKKREEEAAARSKVQDKIKAQARAEENYRTNVRLMQTMEDLGQTNDWLYHRLAEERWIMEGGAPKAQPETRTIWRGDTNTGYAVDVAPKPSLTRSDRAALKDARAEAKSLGITLSELIDRQTAENVAAGRTIDATKPGPLTYVSPWDKPAPRKRMTKAERRAMKEAKARAKDAGISVEELLAREHAQALKAGAAREGTTVEQYLKALAERAKREREHRLEDMTTAKDIRNEPDYTKGPIGGTRDGRRMK